MKITPKLLSLFAFPTLVLIAHFIASKGLHLYAIFPNLDVPFHFIGGLSIAYMTSQIIPYFEKEGILSNPIGREIFALLLFSVTATATVLWEFAEFAIDQWLNTNIQLNLANTMQDQFMGILGGVVWMLLFFTKQRFIAETGPVM